jgi:hypothetical protein
MSEQQTLSSTKKASMRGLKAIIAIAMVGFSIGSYARLNASTRTGCNQCSPSQNQACAFSCAPNPSYCTLQGPSCSVNCGC